MEANGIGQGQETSTPSEPIQSVRETTTPSPAQAEERSFRQSEVNDIVKKVKHEAVESYRRTLAQQPEYAAQKYGSLEPQKAPRSDMSEDAVRRMAGEEAQRLRDEWVKEAQNKHETDQAQRIVQNFWNKVSPGKEKYEDFDQVTGDIEYQRFPNVVQLLADYVDNSDDLLYDLGKDRFKIAQLEQLALMSPKDAIIQAQRMSKSLKDNVAASKVRVPNAPLSQMRPSNAGTDNGVLSVKDLRSRYRV